MQKSEDVVGCIEEVSFPALSPNAVMAKIDTGAYSGALHCESIKRVRKDGKTVLRFRPFHAKSEPIETDQYKATYVTSSSGHRHRRYIIETDIIIKGRRYPILIGLSNRKDMKMDVLIGRRFLRKNNILVDVRLNAELDEDGGGKE